ncbi:MAG: response regulator [Desulfocapsa sp.]|nr:response regulator [Desulfocapsa sp.]
MPYTIALVEDDEALRCNYAKALMRDGYQVDSYSSRPEASTAFSRRLPDLAILDVMLLEEMEGGFELCRELRTLSPTLPIIFLTARNSDLDRVSGLRLGAWDYLTKDTTTLDFLPVRVSALFKMLEAILGNNQRQDETVITHGSVRIEEERKQVSWKDKPVSLTLTEFWILSSLVRRPGHVKSHDQLMNAAQVIVTNNAIAAHVRRIREKFRETDPEFDAICAEYGMGYRWRE